jgi:hypothetical protein
MVVPADHLVGASLAVGDVAGPQRVDEVVIHRFGQLALNATIEST